MQKTFNTQPNLFLSPSDLEHPILHSLDDTEALLDWSKIEATSLINLRLFYWQTMLLV